MPWLALTTTLLAAGLLVDNLRLRDHILELNTEPSQVSTPSSVPTAAVIAEPSPSTGSAAPASNESNDQAVLEQEEEQEEEQETRIADEVAARLEDEVENRMEQELETRLEARVEERIEERHSERREKHRERMRGTVEDFVADAGLSAEIETRMLSVMDDAMTSLGETFRAVHNGEMEREDVRPEMQGIREDMEDALVEILGEKNTQAFQDGIQGPLGRH